GLSVEVFMSIAASAPRPLAPLIGSSLVFSTIIALILNLLFRLGVKKTARLILEGAPVDVQKIDDFFQVNCATWGARPDVAKRATFGAIQLVEAAAGNCWRGGRVPGQASLDEVDLDVPVPCEGPARGFPRRRPSIEQIRNSDDAARLLAGFMLRRNADRIRVDSKDGRATVLFHFDH